MAKFTFSFKFENIEKEPLYYNIQLSVDKDFEWDEDESLPSIFLYKDQPIILQFVENVHDYPNNIEWKNNEHHIILRTYNSSTYMFIAGMMVFNKDWRFPLPETVSVVGSGDTTFIFTPIPVYE